MVKRNWFTGSISSGLNFALFAAMLSVQLPAFAESFTNSLPSTCQNIPAGVQLDAAGCPLDSDHDGVPDYLDKCPETPAGVAVDTSGCPNVVNQTQMYNRMRTTAAMSKAGTPTITADYAGVRIGDSLSSAIAHLKSQGYHLNGKIRLVPGNTDYQDNNIKYFDVALGDKAPGRVDLKKTDKDGTSYTVVLATFQNARAKLDEFKISEIMAQINIPGLSEGSNQYKQIGDKRYPGAFHSACSPDVSLEDEATSDGVSICAWDSLYIFIKNRTYADAHLTSIFNGILATSAPTSNPNF